MSHGIQGRNSPASVDGETARKVAETMQALATPSRVRILARLKEAPCSVGELAEAVGMEQSAVSHQLRLLRHLDLVVGERSGRRTIYALHDSHVGVLLEEAVYHIEHLRLGFPRTSQLEELGVAMSSEHHTHDRAGGHGHSHGLVDASIVRSHKGVKAVSISLVVLLATTLIQIGVFLITNSVALLADLIHNFGDALTALPLGIAFFLRSARGEKAAGYFVVATIFVSACVALWQTIERLIDPQPLSHLGALAAAGAIGFIGNEIAALIRLRAGKRLGSPALIADGYHARTDGLVSLGVVGSALIVAFGFELGDPLIGLAITLVILRITWQSWRTIRAS